MVDLSTEYLGLRLANPLLPSSSPLTGSLDTARQLEDAGAAAIVLPSLFEEAIVAEQERRDRSPAGALGYKSTEDAYLERIVAFKKALDIPVIASLNGSTEGGWIDHGRALEQAGADALELNVYYLGADEADSSESVEARYLSIAEALVAAVTLPIAVKLTSELTAPLHLVRRLGEKGVRGVSIFNRFYQPDIDLETLEVQSYLELSSTGEALSRVRWAAMLHGRVDCDIAVTGGFHNTDSAIKAVLAGADVVHLCSVLLQEGPGALRGILAGMQRWMAEKEYAALSRMKGSMSYRNAADPAGYARANYIDVLHNYRPLLGAQR